MFRRFFPLFLLLSSLLPASGGTEKIILRCAALGIAGNRSTLWTRDSGGKIVSLPLNTHTFGLPIELRLEDRRLPVYSDRPDPEAKEPPPPSFVVSLPTEESLLVMLPEKDSYRGLAVPAGEAKRDGYLLVNLSPAPLAWSMDGGKPRMVAPGGRAFHGGKPGVSATVKIAMRQDDGTFRLARNTMWQMSPGHREFVFVHGTPNHPAFRHLLDSTAR